MWHHFSHKNRTLRSSRSQVLRKEIANDFAQLEGDKVRVRLPGSPQTAELSRGRVAEWVRSQLYRPAEAAALPKLFHQASQGDWSGIVEGILASSRGADNALELGLLFAITCSEDVPFVREQDVPAESEMTFLGSYRLRQQQTACKAWPKSDLSAGYRSALVTDIPTLFVTGDRDGDTPLWFTDHVAAGFARRAMLVMHAGAYRLERMCVATPPTVGADRNNEGNQPQLSSHRATALFSMIRQGERGCVRNHSQRQRTSAKASHRTARENSLAGIGQRWLELERAMGIEPIRAVLPRP